MISFAQCNTLSLYQFVISLITGLDDVFIFSEILKYKLWLCIFISCIIYFTKNQKLITFKHIFYMKNNYYTVDW